MGRLLLRPIIVVLACGLAAGAQKTSAPASPNPEPPPQAGLPSAQEMLSYLNQTIDWYRNFAAEEQVVTDSTESLFINEDRQTGRQILRLAFDFARANAQLLVAKSAAGVAGETASQQSPSGAASSRFETMTRLTTEADAQIKQSQADIDGLKLKLAKAEGQTQRELKAQLDEAQSVMDLAQTRAQTYRSILQTINEAGASEGNGSLVAQIDVLEKSFPEIEPEPAKPATTAPASVPSAPSTSEAPQVTAATTPSGIINLTTSLVDLSRKRQTLVDIINRTERLESAGEKIRKPLVKVVTDDAQQGEEIAKQESADPTTLEQNRHQLDVLTASLKQTSGVIVPLARQSILFGLYKSNLDRWKSTVERQASAESWSLLIHLSILGTVLAAIFFLGHVWHKATLRYVQDMRRRHQFLVLRRIVIWCAAAITLMFGLATELGSLATFAGLITAGIAVALQNVILAVAGYFFLIGRYGVRIGDRVQISGVTGNVVEIGLIRLHLMELVGEGNDCQPTGRIVVFSNSIVFQPNAGFYKQIPGTNFGWHEVTLILAPESNYQEAETRMLEAVEKVYAGYRDGIEQQYHVMQRTFNFAMEVPKPQSRLRLNQTGLEVVIRYPLELEHSAEVDDKITRALMAALERPPKLKLVGTGKVNILPVIDGSPA